MTINMPPRLAPNNAMNVDLACAIFTREIVLGDGSGGVPLPHCNHFSGGKHGPSVVLANRDSIPAPALCVPVRHIVCIGAKEQMRRIAARAVIAGVTDEHANRYWTVGKFPGNAVGANCLCVRPAREAISIPAALTSPGVTSIGAARAVNLFMERANAFFRGILTSRHRRLLPVGWQTLARRGQHSFCRVIIALAAITAVIPDTIALIASAADRWAGEWERAASATLESMFGKVAPEVAFVDAGAEA